MSGADGVRLAGAAGRDRAVIADRDRQEVEHQVRVVDALVAPREAASLEVVGRSRAAAEEEPIGPDPRAVLPFQRGLHRDRELAPVLDVHLEVILQVLADARKIRRDADTEAVWLVGVADPGALEQLRGGDGAARQDYVPGGHGPGLPRAAPALRPDRAPFPADDP